MVCAMTVLLVFLFGVALGAVLGWGLAALHDGRARAPRSDATRMLARRL